MSSKRGKFLFAAKLSRFKLSRPGDYPRAIKVGTETYTIRFVESMRDCLGICDDSRKLIKISRDQTAREMRATFFHEVLHAIEAEYVVKLGERKIKRIEWALCQVMLQLSQNALAPTRRKS